MYNNLASEGFQKKNSIMTPFIIGSEERTSHTSSSKAAASSYEAQSNGIVSFE